MSKLGSRPLVPATPAPTPAAVPETDESRQFDSEFEEHLQHLRSLDPSDPHFPQDATDALDLLSSHIGGWEQGDQLKARIKQATASKARNALAEHLSWAESSFPPGVDRGRAQLHGLSLYAGDLDPIIDAEILALADQAFGKTPSSNEEET